MSVTLLAFGLLLGSAPAAAAPPSGAGSPAAAGTVLARIGSYTLTLDLFEAFWQALPPDRRAGYEQAGGRRAFLDDLVDQKLVVVEAERRGYLDRPELRAQAELARDAVLYRELVEQEVTARVVTPEAMRAFYEAHPERYRVDEQVRARHILVTPHRDTTVHNTTGDDATTEAEAQAKAERLRGELAAGADFAAVARRSSEDLTAPRGGELPLLARGRMAGPLEDAAFSLAPGTVSGVIRTPYGFHLLRVEERIPAHVAPFEEVRADVRRAVSEERRDAFRPRFEKLVQELRGRIEVTVDRDALPAAPPSSRAGAGGSR